MTTRRDFSRLALQLRVMRLRTKLTLSDLAYRSGVGLKSLSSFECDPARTATIKLATLDALTRACGTNLHGLLAIVPSATELDEISMRLAPSLPVVKYVLERWRGR